MIDVMIPLAVWHDNAAGSGRRSEGETEGPRDGEDKVCFAALHTPYDNTDTH